MTERLTEKSENGFYIVDKHKASIFMYNKYFAGQAINKLAEYETAEEEGRLVVLPCKVGSVAYSICHRYTKCSKYGESFEEYSCSGCEELNCDSHKEYYIHVNQSVSLEWIIRNMQLGNFEKTVFLTRGEAEKALKDKMDFHI